MTGIFALLSVIALFMAYGARKSSQEHTKTIFTLTRELAELRNQLNILQSKSPVQSESDKITPIVPSSSQEAISTPISTPIPKPASISPKSKQTAPVIKAHTPVPHEPDWFERITANIQSNWMVWLGGISVGLAGIFMVSHSVRTGLIGPNAQVILALITGVALHSGAEILRRRNQGTHQVFAALAGGGSITLYAALLTGIHYYQIISPLFAFTALAAVAFATMALSLIHGPVLAILGLTSAYAVPLLTGSDGGSITIVLSYTLIVTLASLLLTRFVFRLWLWRATLFGAMGWWLLAVATEPVQVSTVVYLAVLLWAFIVIPIAEAAPQASESTAASTASVIHKAKGRFSPLPIQAGLLILSAWAISMAGQPDDTALHWSWLVLLPVTALISHQRPAAWYLTWGAVATNVFGWLLYAVEFNHNSWFLTTLDANMLVPYLALCSIGTILIGAWFWLKQVSAHPTQNPKLHRWMSYTLLPPVLFFLFGYLILGGHEHPHTWSGIALIFGVSYGALAAVFQKYDRYRPALIWAILGIHSSYSLAVVFYFSEAALTLALAFQFISLSVLAKRFELPWLYLILKVVLAVVITRLTFNPWLASYDLGGHWSLWTYGGSTLFTVIATRIIPKEEPIRRWLEAAALHLFVLFAGAELRYWLYDGDIFASEFSMTEATINMLLWGSLAITYDIRAGISESLAKLYRLFSAVLLGLSAICYLLLLTKFNPWWSGELISATPVFNILLPAYLGASLLALAVLLRLSKRTTSHITRQVERYLQGFAGANFLLFTLLEIRQLWSGADLSLNNSTSEGELYTYSVIGLLYATAAIMSSARFSKPILYKVGMGLIAAVVAKIFLVDMSGLQGFWRVAAFMGLGLVLLGLAWKYQKTTTSSGSSTQNPL
jgi:uncharacterized membrane protein